MCCLLSPLLLASSLLPLTFTRLFRHDVDIMLRFHDATQLNDPKAPHIFGMNCPLLGVFLVFHSVKKLKKLAFYPMQM